MTEQQNLLLNPVFRYGMPAMSSLAIVAIAFLIVDDQIVRVTMLLVAAVEIIVTPWVLRRAGQQNAADTETNSV